MNYLNHRFDFEPVLTFLHFLTTLVVSVGLCYPQTATSLGMNALPNCESLFILDLPKQRTLLR